MKTILVIGLGRFGRHIAKKLYDLNHQVMAIDMNEERVQSVLPYVTNAQIGDSTSEDFISGLGVCNFDACIVAIGDNFQNSLETTSILKEMGAKKVIARASTGIHEKFLMRNGADEVVYPEKQLASWTAVRCTSDSILDYIAIDSSHSIFELSVPKEWNGKTLMQLDIRRKYGINILGILEDGTLNTAVSPDKPMRGGQSILVLGNEKSLQKCFKL